MGNEASQALQPTLNCNSDHSNFQKNKNKAKDESGKESTLEGLGVNEMDSSAKQAKVYFVRTDGDNWAIVLHFHTAGFWIVVKGVRQSNRLVPCYKKDFANPPGELMTSQAARAVLGAAVPDIDEISASPAQVQRVASQVPGSNMAYTEGTNDSKSWVIGAASQLSDL